MTVYYDVFTEAFLAKITEYNFVAMDEYDREVMVDGYMKRACAQFAPICRYDITNGNEHTRSYKMDGISEWELDEIVDIVSEGMVVQWLKQYTYKQENLENMLNTTDYSSYSPAELLKRVVEAYKNCRKEFIAMMRDYSYRHGDLTDLHL